MNQYINENDAALLVSSGTNDHCPGFVHLFAKQGSSFNQTIDYFKVPHHCAML